MPVNLAAPTITNPPVPVRTLQTGDFWTLVNAQNLMESAQNYAASLVAQATDAETYRYNWIDGFTAVQAVQDPNDADVIAIVVTGTALQPAGFVTATGLTAPASLNKKRRKRIINASGWDGGSGFGTRIVLRHSVAGFPLTSEFFSPTQQDIVLLPGGWADIEWSDTGFQNPSAVYLAQWQITSHYSPGPQEIVTVAAPLGTTVSTSLGGQERTIIVGGINNGGSWTLDLPTSSQWKFWEGREVTCHIEQVIAGGTVTINRGASVLVSYVVTASIDDLTINLKWSQGRWYFESDAFVSLAGQIRTIP
jgi:hypothetical protein